MRKLLPILFVAILLVSCKKDTKKNEEPADRGYIVEVGDIAPDFETQLMDGSTFKLSDCRGKVVMLQFTASWCGVCRKEMPFIEKEIHQVHQDKDFIVIGIDRDEPLEKMQKFAKDTGITYPLAFDPDANIFALYAHKEAGVTRNVIINREGKIIYLTRLFNREEFDAMKKVIEEELAK
ncbi:peroxiredoxin [Balneicella halophila]|uniref:Peroxiredoxin n=1 Tax=Balneicella halophila TaxID=1537566 RepID=A0A7L4USD0_BALHA|nr:TlpA disulfide reductase family protein [Balneicella halophila]PVX52331.1 peroxiredoxin [Balneicella halophila]